METRQNRQQSARNGLIGKATKKKMQGECDSGSARFLAALPAARHGLSYTKNIQLAHCDMVQSWPQRGARKSNTCNVQYLPLFALRFTHDKMRPVFRSGGHCGLSLYTLVNNLVCDEAHTLQALPALLRRTCERILLCGSREKMPEVCCYWNITSGSAAPSKGRNGCFCPCCQSCG